MLFVEGLMLIFMLIVSICNLNSIMRLIMIGDDIDR
jgi:hypothetical protein